MTAPVAFTHPAALLLLPLVLLAVRLGRRRSGWRWRAATALRAATLGLLIVALGGPLLRAPLAGVAVVFAVDRSLSITPEGQRAEAAFVREALSRMRRDDRAGVIAFAGSPLLQVPVEAHPAVEDLGRPIDPDATDIGAALGLGQRMLGEAGARRIVLLSDGAENRGDAAAAARVARAAGVAVDVVPIAAGRPDEVLVEALTAPQDVRAGEAYEIRAVVRSTVPGEAAVTLSRNGDPVEVRRVRLAPGQTAVPFSDIARREGAVRYRVDVAASPDTISENNHGDAIVVVRGRPRVLFVTASPTRLPAWLSGQGLRVDVRLPEEVPAQATGFVPYGSLVLNDVPALDLTQAQQEAIRAFVGTAGGGLVAIGGGHSYGVGGYAGTPLEEILPVTMDVRQTVAVPTVAIVLMIDTSGSMDAFGTEVAKEELAKEIASSVIDLLGAHDLIGVITFDQEYRWLVPPTEARNRSRVLEQIARLKAGGGTVMAPPLRAAREYLRATPARIRHVIVLSDGLTDPGDFPGIVAAMTRDKITLSSVAIGRDADTEFMRNLARWGGGRAYVAKDLYSVPKIFTAEALMAVRAFIVEEPVVPAPVGAGPTLAGLTPPPALRGYVATVAKPLADVALVTPRRDPLLATWRYGLGRTVAFTSDDGLRWTAPWGSWPDVARFWSQAIRWTLPVDAAGLHLAAAVGAGGSEARAVLDARRPGGAPWDGLDVNGDVTGPGGERRSIVLEQTGPGRYESTWPAPRPGTYTLTLAAHDARRLAATRTVGLVVPYSAEYRLPDGNPALLSRLVETTGGAFLARPEDAFRPGRGTGEREAWPALTGAALGLWLAEITLRRLPALGQRLVAFAGAAAHWAGRREAASRTARAEADASYDTADRWAVEEARFAEEETLRAASMEQAARLFIARLRGTKRR
ncbi:MAG: VWA domain-containing protein [Bacillati bacterium ANGP1]|uniref:VWA domain-containing protein n=1 Tax=Candidatus Segetimicrobium genomatis TaxID=2569760 RepID=A0A537K4G0_9BACT|nr:MAG: VWA domain-containing protein [Terrabacteria group bacterium ANGP1]